LRRILIIIHITSSSTLCSHKYTTNASLKFCGSSKALVAHACNPSYSGGSNQEDRGSKPAWANRQTVRETLPQKYLTQKRSGGMAQGVALRSSPSIEK
jgi:hypothetical protein